MVTLRLGEKAGKRLPYSEEFEAKSDCILIDIQLSFGARLNSDYCRYVPLRSGSPER